MMGGWTWPPAMWQVEIQNLSKFKPALYLVFIQDFVALRHLHWLLRIQNHRAVLLDLDSAPVNWLPWDPSLITEYRFQSIFPSLVTLCACIPVVLELLCAQPLARAFCILILFFSLPILSPASYISCSYHYKFEHTACANSL